MDWIQYSTSKTAPKDFDGLTFDDLKGAISDATWVKKIGPVTKTPLFLITQTQPTKKPGRIEALLRCGAAKTALTSAKGSGYPNDKEKKTVFAHLLAFAKNNHFKNTADQGPDLMTTAAMKFPMEDDLLALLAPDGEGTFLNTVANEQSQYVYFPCSYTVH